MKDLIVGTDTRHYDGWRGAQQLDFFDPNFENYVHPPPCRDCTHYIGTLRSLGDVHYHPDGYYYSWVTGEHKGWLRGPAGTNFNLYLIKSDGPSWYVVAKSTGSTSSEEITYVAPPGYYTWRVVSSSGGGSYDFWVKQP